MIKKIFKWIGIVIGIIILLVIVAGVVLMLVVDEKMIASYMEKALNRHVTISKIDVGVFALASGIEVRDVKISNFKTQKELAALKDKPVAESDLFVGLKAFNFKLKISQLFKLRFVLDELVLYEPRINVIKNKNGVMNFADLIKPSGAKKEEVQEKPSSGPSKPLKADDIPVEITVGKVGVEKGRLKYADQKLGQTFQVYDLTALVHSIKLDPKDLKNKDSVEVKVLMGLKTIGELKSGSVKSFDIGFDIKGVIIPFDKKTRLLNPEADLKIGLPYGSMTGLQIYDKMKSVEQLAKYSGKFDFLKKNLDWKNAYVGVWYKDSLVKLKEGKITTDDYTMNYEGETNIKTKALDMDLDMLLADKHKKPIQSGIEKNAKKAISGKYAKYVKPEKVAELAMKAITDKDGKLYLKYKVKGKLNDPDMKLVSPKVPSMTDLVKDAAGDIKDVVKDKAKEEAKEQTEKAKDKAKDKAASKLKKLKFK